jgi:hypothetical protein
MYSYVSVSYDHLQKAQQHVEETSITLIIVHQVESKILNKTKCVLRHCMPQHTAKGEAVQHHRFLNNYTKGGKEH